MFVVAGGDNTGLHTVARDRRDVQRPFEALWIVEQNGDLHKKKNQMTRGKRILSGGIKYQLG